MSPVLAISRQTGIKLAEVRFLLILIAGVWLVAAELLDERWREFRMVVVGLCLAAAGGLLIVACTGARLVESSASQAGLRGPGSRTADWPR
jgi:hypothetical protein